MTETDYWANLEFLVCREFAGMEERLYGSCGATAHSRRCWRSAYTLLWRETGRDPDPGLPTPTFVFGKET